MITLAESGLRAICLLRDPFKSLPLPMQGQEGSYDRLATHATTFRQDALPLSSAS